MCILSSFPISSFISSSLSWNILTTTDHSSWCIIHRHPSLIISISTSNIVAQLPLNNRNWWHFAYPNSSLITAAEPSTPPLPLCHNQAHGHFSKSLVRLTWHRKWKAVHNPKHQQIEAEWLSSGCWMKLWCHTSHWFFSANLGKNHCIYILSSQAPPCYRCKMHPPFTTHPARHDLSGAWTKNKHRMCWRCVPGWRWRPRGLENRLFDGSP